jgi:3-phenylpropionate/cinnamic acid dioxygenase small subunit
MDAELLHAIGKYLWLPLAGVLGWFMKTLHNQNKERHDITTAQINDFKDELTEIKLNYITREELQRTMDSFQKQLDKHDTKLDRQDVKLDRILEKL